MAVIDLGLPKVSGIDVIKEVRRSGAEYPILILTARSDWQDKVHGLEAGADDYLVKPFHIQEFLARLEALIRRATGQFKPSLEAGPIHLDTRRKRVCVSGQGVDLTAYEFNLLQYLMHRPGEVISKSELTDHLYEQDYDKDSNVIEVFIGRLRKKLDPNNALNPIETVRGLGYRFELPIS
jgi:two-component system response regulator PhoP